VLESGGTFYIQRKLPPTDPLPHEEIVRQLQGLAQKVDRLLEALVAQ
jgi:hypothetical protein